MLPEEGRYLVSNPGRFRWKEAKLSAKRALFRRAFSRSLRDHDERRKARRDACTQAPTLT
jgi:hypothetical protein